MNINVKLLWTSDNGVEFAKHLELAIIYLPNLLGCVLAADIHNVAMLELHYVYFGDIYATTGYFY